MSLAICASRVRSQIESAYLRCCAPSAQAKLRPSRSPSPGMICSFPYQYQFTHMSLPYQVYKPAARSRGAPPPSGRARISRAQLRVYSPLAASLTRTRTQVRVSKSDLAPSPTTLPPGAAPAASTPPGPPRAPPPLSAPSPPPHRHRCPTASPPYHFVLLKSVQARCCSSRGAADPLVS